MKEKGKLRILGVLGKDKFSGSKLHRIELPLNKLKGSKIFVNGGELEIDVQYYRQGNEGFEPMLSQSDVLYNGWLIGLNAGLLGTLLTKHNVKLIQDYDDVFFLPESHKDYQRNSTNLKNHIGQITLADAITVATPRLAEWMGRFKKMEGDYYPVLISHNHLPFEGQWKYIPKVKKEGEKIRIAIYGSSSHLHDWELLKGMIKILGNNKEFVKKCKFVIGGAPIAKHLFSGIKAEVEYVAPKEVYNYMDILDHVDILLAPLEENEFNLSKSNIKILESALRDIPVVASEYYLNKGMDVCIVRNPEDWQKWVWELIKDDKYLEVGRMLGEKNRAISNWDKRIEDLKVVLSYVAEKEYKPLEDLKVFGICYKPEHYTEYEQYFNQTKEKAWRFEYSPIIDIVNNKIGNFKGYIGMFSWKFPFKTNISKKILESILLNIKEEGENPDVIGLSPNYFKYNYLKFSYNQHPKLKEILQKVCDKLGMELPKEVDKVVYSNFFLAKSGIYKKYVNEVIIPALDYMEKEIWDLVNTDAEYKSGLKQEELEKYTGLSYYNHITFVLERMLSIWLWNNKDIIFKQIG